MMPTVCLTPVNPLQTYKEAEWCLCLSLPTSDKPAMACARTGTGTRLGKVFQGHAQRVRKSPPRRPRGSRTRGTAHTRTSPDAPRTQPPEACAPRGGCDNSMTTCQHKARYQASSALEIQNYGSLNRNSSKTGGRIKTLQYERI